jgi:hypothetical protein
VTITGGQHQRCSSVFILAVHVGVAFCHQIVHDVHVTTTGGRHLRCPFVVTLDGADWASKKSSWRPLAMVALGWSVPGRRMRRRCDDHMDVVRYLVAECSADVNSRRKTEGQR